MSCDPLHARLRSITPSGDFDRDAWRAFDAIFEQLCARPLTSADQAEVWALLERAPECENDFTWNVIHSFEAVPGHEAALTSSLMARSTRLGLTMLRRRINAGLPVDDALLAALRRHREEPGRLGEDAGELVDLLAGPSQATSAPAGRKSKAARRASSQNEGKGTGKGATARSSTRRGGSRSGRRRPDR